MSSAEPTEAEPTAAQPTAAGPAARTGPGVRSPVAPPVRRPPFRRRSLGLAESARLLADATTTSTALVADALARIEAYPAHLNAFRHLRAEAALAEAAEADRRLAAGSGFPCSACRSPSRTTPMWRACPRTSAATATCPRRVRQ